MIGFCRGIIFVEIPEVFDFEIECSTSIRSVYEGDRFVQLDRREKRVPGVLNGDMMESILESSS